MGFRFRRTAKILPGVRVNINKDSLSVSVGPRGAKTTIGANGVRQTIGIPGTGLFYTTTKKYKDSNNDGKMALESIPQSSMQSFCANCGSKLPKDAKFCPTCGAQITEQTLSMDDIYVPEHIVELNGVQFDAIQFAYKYDIFNGILNSGRAALDLQEATGASREETTRFVTELLKDEEVKKIVSEIDEYISAHYCPKCHSSNIQFSKQGFSVGKAVIGGILTGGIGAIAGFHGRNRMKGKCLKCGYEWKV